MNGFYAEGGYTLNQAHAELAFAALLNDPRLGRVWIIQSAQQEDAGHVVLTIKYAMEYGGLSGCIDDLYVLPAYRNRGLAKAALTEVKTFCKQAGIRSLTVEVGFNNAPAQAVYRATGFSDVPDRQLLAIPLASPTHV